MHLGNSPSRLGTPLQAKLLLGESIIYLLRHAPQAGAWGEIYVPKQELGNEGKAGCPALSRTVPCWAQDLVGSVMAVQAPEKSLTKSAQKR